LHDTKAAVLDLTKAKEHPQEPGDSAAALLKRLDAQLAERRVADAERLARQAEQLARLEKTLDRLSTAIPEALNETVKTVSTGLSDVQTQLGENGKLRHLVEGTEQNVSDTKVKVLDLAKAGERLEKAGTDGAATLKNLDAQFSQYRTADTERLADMKKTLD